MRDVQCVSIPRDNFFSQKMFYREKANIPEKKVDNILFTHRLFLSTNYRKNTFGILEVNKCMPDVARRFRYYKYTIYRLQTYLF